MARLTDRLSNNADGDFYVDRSCIDCAVCRTVAPATFVRDDAAQASVVARQPKDASEALRAEMALVACPTSSIGTREKRRLDDAIARFPEPLGDDVYFCGFASERSYGAQSYLLRRPDGNVLVDSPRAVPRLLDAIEALGGVRFMFLTHRDDVADHAKFAQRFGCTRVMHAADVGSDTRDVEHVVEGDAVVSLADDLRVIPVPGHTRGSAALLYRDLALFTGDHLFADERGSLYAARECVGIRGRRSGARSCASSTSTSHGCCQATSIGCAFRPPPRCARICGRRSIRRKTEASAPRVRRAEALRPPPRSRAHGPGSTSRGSDTSRPDARARI